MSYSPRLTRPTSKDKYYITVAKGGYSKAIEGKCKDTGKADTQCNALANCVGYAYGRFHEIAQDKTMSYVSPVNAEIFPEYAPKCKQGTTPKLGSIIVWQVGTTSGSDGAGHVAIVENIISDTQILISQSGYNSNVFWTETCTLKNGNWLCSWMNSKYKFRCFIYNPEVSDSDRPVLKQGSTGKYVSELQTKLNTTWSYALTIDGIFGSATVTAVKDFQRRNSLTADGIVGDTTWAKLDAQQIKPEGVSDLTFLLDSKKVTAWGSLLGGQNYIRMLDLEKLGIVKSVTYNSTKKMPEVKTK